MRAGRGGRREKSSRGRGGCERGGAGGAAGSARCGAGERRAGNGEPRDDGSGCAAPFPSFPPTFSSFLFPAFFPLPPPFSFFPSFSFLSPAFSFPPPFPYFLPPLFFLRNNNHEIMFSRGTSCSHEGFPHTCEISTLCPEYFGEVLLAELL